MITINQAIILVLTLMKEKQLSHDSLNSRNQWLKTYDYIVIGAGASGSVVAARLAEDSSKYVLLVEAGGPVNQISDMPALQPQLTGGTFDWNYPIVPQKHAYNQYVDNKVNISRGLAFGGCSMHNSMNYYRGSEQLFQAFTDLTGVKNWTFNDVLPYFTKSENNLDEELVKNNTNIYGVGGPLIVTTAVPDPILQAQVVAAQIMGRPLTYPDGREPFGTTIMQRNIKDGVRQSTALVFLEKLPKKNLHILGETFVTKILFNESKRAIGVQFYRDNMFHRVLARNEIILSAGSIGSTHLLMLSGVGHKQHLQNFGIPVISDLAVGDHFLTSFASTFNFDIKDQSMIEKPIENFNNYYKFYVEHSGPLSYKASGLTCFHEMAYDRYQNVSNGCIMPRIAYMGTNLENMVKNLKLKEEWKEYYRPYLNKNYFPMMAKLSHPKSTGRVRLASPDPFQYPIIDPCILCVEKDLDDLVKTFKLALDIYLSQYMRPFIEIFQKSIPGCNPCSAQYFCDSYIRCVIQSTIPNVYPEGGCRIGISSDKRAVVDERLKVFGVSGLRVIDSSILPINFEQSHSISIMIGEYGSQFIKDDNN